MPSHLTAYQRSISRMTPNIGESLSTTLALGLAGPLYAVTTHGRNRLALFPFFCTQKKHVDFWSITKNTLRWWWLCVLMSTTQTFTHNSNTIGIWQKTYDSGRDAKRCELSVVYVRSICVCDCVWLRHCSPIDVCGVVYWEFCRLQAQSRAQDERDACGFIVSTNAET